MLQQQVPNPGISVDFEELGDGMPNEKWSATGFSATEEYKVAWGDVPQFADDVLGGVNSLDEGSGDFTITRARKYARFTEAVAMDVDVSGYGKNNQTHPGPLTYDFAKCVVSYSVPSDAPSEDADSSTPLVTETLEPMVEFQTMPHHKLFWTYTATGTPEDPLTREQSPGKLIFLLNWQYTIHHMPRVPTSFINQVGTVNNAAVVSPTFGFGFPIETLLFNGPRLTREIHRSGARAWTVDMSYTYRPTEWNKFQRNAGADFQKLLDENEVDVNVYELSDFSNLLVFPGIT